MTRFQAEISISVDFSLSVDFAAQNFRNFGLQNSLEFQDFIDWNPIEKWMVFKKISALRAQEIYKEKTKEIEKNFRAARGKE